MPEEQNDPRILHQDHLISHPVNLIPGVNWVAFKLSDWLAPTLFVIHTVLVFVLLVDAVFYMAFKLIRRVF